MGRNLMGKILMGVETEYALGGQSRDAIIRVLLGLLPREVSSMPGVTPSDRFFSNGSRFYVDAGPHPELDTPECSNPTDVVRYLRAGDRMLARAMDKLPEPLSLEPGLGLFKCNVDYSGGKTTWGSHESYMHVSPPGSFQDPLVPHLVSRVIFAGAGGFNPFSDGIEFTLSPRARHLVTAVAGSSTGERGIFHTKNEPLARRGFHRLHLLCGESLCSEIANWLRVGTTALVVSMVDAGLDAGLPLRLKAPVGALRGFAADPTCRVTAELEDRRRLTAVEIQRHYLHAAEQHLTHASMPIWAREVCEVWARTLDTLEREPESLSTTLDWAIKLAIFKKRVSQKGIRWKDLPAWNHVIKTIVSAVHESSYKGRATVELVLGKETTPSPIPDTITALTSYVESHSLSWDLLRPVINLRRELFELDFRFGQIGENGLFEQLERSGVLTHRAPGVENIEEAVTQPPAEGRARVRGEYIRTCVDPENHMCFWDSICDIKGCRKLDLSNPFVRQPKWKPLEEKEAVSRDPIHMLFDLGRRSG